MQKGHKLKITREHFRSIVLCEKKCEFRIDDRRFGLCDLLLLSEYSHELERYSGHQMILRITHICKDEDYLQPGFAALSFAICWVSEEALRYLKFDKSVVTWDNFHEGNHFCLAKNRF